MSERARLVAEVFRRVGNPFVVCKMISVRARQWMSANSQWAGPEAITQALRELAAEALEFKMPNGGAQGFPSAEKDDKQTAEAQGAQMSSAVTERGVETTAK